MTLHYTDLGTDNRLEPAVHGADVLTHPMAKNTASISPRAVGSSAGKVITKDSRIIANDGTNNIGLFGFDDAGNMVLKIAQTGFDANSATNSQLIFNSQQDTFKIINPGGSTATVSLPIGSYHAVQTWTTTIAHGLSTTPGVSAFVNLSTLPSLAVSTGLSPVPGIGITATSGLGTNVFLPGYIADVSVDSTNLYFTVSWLYGALALGSNYTVSFKYYILQETAN